MHAWQSWTQAGVAGVPPIVNPGPVIPPIPQGLDPQQMLAYQQFYAAASSQATGAFNATQWTPAQMQQNWQQWQQWQEKYNQWQQQYGKKYAESLATMGQGGGPVAGPATPFAENPPLPNSEPAPPPPPDEEKPPPPTTGSQDTGEKEELSEAEKTFDIQFKQWEEQFNAWRNQNADHPDKAQYKVYEKKWETWREQLLQRREQMKKKRLESKTNQEKQDSSAQAGPKTQPETEQQSKPSPVAAPKTLPIQLASMGPFNNEPLRFGKPMAQYNNSQMGQPQQQADQPPFNLPGFAKNDQAPKPAGTSNYNSPVKNQGSAPGQGFPGRMFDQQPSGKVPSLFDINVERPSNYRSPDRSEKKNIWARYEEEDDYSKDPFGEGDESPVEKTWPNKRSDNVDPGRHNPMRQSWSDAGNKPDKTQLSGYVGSLLAKIGNLSSVNPGLLGDSDERDTLFKGVQRPGGIFGGRSSDSSVPNRNHYEPRQGMDKKLNEYGRADNNRMDRGPNQDFDNVGPRDDGFDDNRGPDRRGFGNSEPGRGEFDGFGRGRGGFNNFGPGQERFDRFGQGPNRGGFNDGGPDRGGFDMLGPGRGGRFDNSGPGRDGFNDSGRGRFEPSRAGPKNPDDDRGYDDSGVDRRGFDNRPPGLGGFENRSPGGFDIMGPGRLLNPEFGRGGFNDIGNQGPGRFGGSGRGGFELWMNRGGRGPQRGVFGTPDDKDHNDMGARFGRNCEMNKLHIDNSDDKLRAESDAMKKEQGGGDGGNDDHNKDLSCKDEDLRQSRPEERSKECFGANNRGFDRKDGHGHDPFGGRDNYGHEGNRMDMRGWDRGRGGARGNFPIGGDDMNRFGRNFPWLDDATRGRTEMQEMWKDGGPRRLSPWTDNRNASNMEPEWKPQVFDYSQQKPPRIEGELEFAVVDYGHGAKSQKQTFDYGHGSDGKTPDIPKLSDVTTIDYGHKRTAGSPIRKPDLPPKVIDYGHGGSDDPATDWKKERDRDIEENRRRRSRTRSRSRERDRRSPRRGRDERDRFRRDTSPPYKGGQNRGRDRQIRGGNRWNRDRGGSEKEGDIEQNNTEEKTSCTSSTSSEVTTVLVEDLICAPGRSTRPHKIAFIMRGLPGSGKTYVTKLIKDKEVEASGSGSAIRTLSLDDYFMTEVEKEETEADTGKKIKKKCMEYEYEASMEPHYRSALLKAFKKTVTDGFFSFIIVDSVNEKAKQVEEMWSFAKQNGFQVYIAEMDNDLSVCIKRNTHKRSEEDISKISKEWEETAKHYIRLDVRSLVQSDAITDVEMEVVEEDVAPQKSSEDVQVEKEEKEEETREGELTPLDFVKSKWDTYENTEQNLDRLDGLKRRRDGKVESMEDFLQLPDYEAQQTKLVPGKKRVRWADLEERRKQEKMRAIGFVVGQTDWSRMTDPTFGEGALTRTKYI